MYYFYFVTRPIFVFIWNRIYKKIVREKNKSLALTFISTFRYIDEVLSINNCYVHINIYSINPSEIMIIDIIDLKSTTSVLYFDTLLERDIECNLTIELYDDKHGDDFYFSIFNIPYLCSKIPPSPAYWVIVSQLIRYMRACSTYKELLRRCKLLTNKLIKQYYQQSRLKLYFRKFYGLYNGFVSKYNLTLHGMLTDVFHTYWYNIINHLSV